MRSRSDELARHLLVDEIVVGVSAGTPEVDAEAFDVLLTTRPDPPRPWVCGDADIVETAVQASPAAAVTLVQVLRSTESLPVPIALTVESMAYSMLQHGEVFQRWLAARPDADATAIDEAEPVRLERDGDRLDVVLQRPHVHNAFNASMRDALCEAFELVGADPSITSVHVRGDGPSFCSGGDLREFGTSTDAAAAHLIRTTRNVGRLVHRHADRVTVELHGNCIGAGIEIGAFAGRVVAAPDTSIRLPELAMGLIPGAGGTVSLPRRIGRHRAAWLALTGAPIDAAVATAWGLVDEVR